VAQSYAKRGYDPLDWLGVRFTSHHALPDTTTFIARAANQIVATLSLVADNSLLGLPMESIYGPEIEQLRQDGRRLVEVTGLADHGLSLREFLPIFVALMRLSSQFGIRQRADTWVITVNPRHRSFYQKVMGFEQIGETRAYPSVQDHPAEAFMIDMPLLQANAPAMYQQVFGESLPADALTAPRMPTALMREFADRSRHTDRGTVDQILEHVNCFGSPRRWL
jgi:hypothetical protein